MLLGLGIGRSDKGNRRSEFSMTDPSAKKIALEHLDVSKQIEVNTGAGAAPPSQPSLPPNTTAEENMVSAGQRTINYMWEGTQKNIALQVTVVVLVVCTVLIVNPYTPEALRMAAFTTLSNVFFSVIAVYFTRTNHTKIGGVGSKPMDTYVGR